MSQRCITTVAYAINDWSPRHLQDVRPYCCLSILPLGIDQGIGVISDLILSFSVSQLTCLLDYRAWIIGILLAPPCGFGFPVQIDCNISDLWMRCRAQFVQLIDSVLCRFKYCLSGKQLLPVPENGWGTSESSVKTRPTIRQRTPLKKQGAIKTTCSTCK